jgi:hypothetical protein
MQSRLARSIGSPRGVAIASLGCVVIGAIACGSEAETVTGSAPVVLAAEAAPVAIDVAPSHGGTMVLAGSHPVEVVPHASGHVYAYVPEDALSPADTELAVVVPVTGGVRTVELEWDGGERRWAGRVRRAEIVPGPVDVVLVAGGSRWVGHVATIVVQPAIVVVAPSPTVVVAAPPPGVVVIEHDRGKHRKHRKHRGRGHRGRGDVEIHFGH